MNWIQAYPLFNKILALILGLVICFMVLFSVNPKLGIPCYYKAHFHQSCPTCGMTRAFAKILKGEINQALILNKNSIFILIFIIIQLILRSFMIWLFPGLKNTKEKEWILYADSVFSIFTFLFVFYPMIIFIILGP